FIWWPNLSAVSLGAFVLLVVVLYHLVYAPGELENNREWMSLQTPAESANLQTVWHNAWHRNPTPGDQLRAEPWSRMSLSPYLASLPYSIVNYVFVAVPMLHLFFTSALHRFRVAKYWWCRRIPAAIRTYERKPEKARAILAGAFERCGRDLNSQ